MKTLFIHASTGNNIEGLGLRCLAGLRDEPENFPQECIIYALNPYVPYDKRNWDWPLWSDTSADAISKTDQFVGVINSQHQNYDVMGMKYCYVDSYNLDFDYYKTKMEQLEQAYPQKTFIWATSALYSTNSMVPGNADNIQAFNQQLRTYARANNKVLYDLADIKSHDPSGNSCTAGDLEGLCMVYSDGYGGGGGGHPDVEGSIRLAKGFWWLMARVSGWNGN